MPSSSVSPSDTAIENIHCKTMRISQVSEEDCLQSKPSRAISKTGACNVTLKTSKTKRLAYFTKDLFTSILEARWRWTLLAFITVYFGTWYAFAVLWYLILWLHGDIENFGREGWKPCVSNIQNFTSAFLFSVETQHTTGYGFYELREQCSSAVLLFCAQSIVGTILEGVMVGLVFIKTCRAKRRSDSILFSKYAVICMRDGVLCLLFRVADTRKTHLLEAEVRAQIVKKKVTVEGEVISDHREELKVGGDGEKDNKVLLFWPTFVVHKITESSPLHGVTQDDLNNDDDFEIIVVLDGILEATGLNVQARSSYLPSEILWSHRFENLPSAKTEDGRIIDYSMFHDVKPVKMD